MRARHVTLALLAGVLNLLPIAVSADDSGEIRARVERELHEVGDLLLDRLGGLIDAERESAAENHRLALADRDRRIGELEAELAVLRSELVDRDATIESLRKQIAVAEATSPVVTESNELSSIIEPIAPELDDSTSPSVEPAEELESSPPTSSSPLIEALREAGGSIADALEAASERAASAERQPATASVAAKTGEGTATPALAETEAAFLGVYVDSSDGALFVESVHRDSAADRYGVFAGDTIVEIDRKAVSSFEDLAEAISSKNAGGSIHLTIERDGATIDFPLVLGTRPATRVEPSAADLPRSDDASTAPLAPLAPESPAEGSSEPKSPTDTPFEAREPERIGNAGAESIESDDADTGVTDPETAPADSARTESSEIDATDVQLLAPPSTSEPAATGEASADGSSADELETFDEGLLE